MLAKYCLKNERVWDEGISLLLFAIRDCPSVAFGFSPLQLVFSHEVRGPPTVLKEIWLADRINLSLSEYV